MARYRIVQLSKNCFKPQMKTCWFWYDFGSMYITKTFRTEAEADEFLRKYMEEHETEKYPKVVATWG